MMYDWTVMIFVSSDNFLGEQGLERELLRKVEEAGIDDRVAVVVQHDPFERGRPTTRTYHVRNGWCDILGERNSGDPQTLLDFVHAAKRNCPSDKRALLFWDHSNGWVDENALKEWKKNRALPRVLRGAGFDQANGDDLSVAELRYLARRIGPLDVLAFDACYMGLLEIAYQFRGAARMMVASEERLPGAPGWPYHAILRALQSNPALDGRQFAEAIVQQFGTVYDAQHHPVTLAAIDMEMIAPLLAPLSRLSFALMDHIKHHGVTPVKNAQAQAKKFMGNAGYIDLVSFCQRARDAAPEIAPLADRVISAVQRSVLARFVTQHHSMAEAHGLGITFPAEPLPLSYGELDFAMDCSWVSLLQAAVGVAEYEDARSTPR
ncbi:MAG TPA: clostripain-related cysteine peptidase [Thermoanaerobaculia bacterium]